MAKARRITWIGYGVIALFLLLPFGLAQMGGADAFCGLGASSVGTVLLVETGVLLLLALGLQVAGDRFGPTGAQLRPIAWSGALVLAMAAAPFFVALRTESSVCSRGRAFFWESVLVEAYVLAIVAISYNLLFGFTGVISFGHAAFFGTGAYLVGVLTVHFELAWWLAVVLTLVAGAVIGLIMGFVGLRIKGLYFAMFTLAFAEVFYLLVGNRILVEYTGAEDGFTYPVPDLLNVTNNRLFYYYLVVVILLACYLLVRRLMDSPTGRVLSAIRENEERARMLGYNSLYFKLIAIVTSGVMATLAGILRGIANKGASPNVLGVGVTVDALLQTIIGGLGTFFGPALGAFGLHLLEFTLRDRIVTLGETTVDIGQYWALILGILFILVVLAFPFGLVGTWQQKELNTLAGWRRWLTRK